MASFFSTLDPESQTRLLDAAAQALGAQHRSIGRNTANASRIREYLNTNDAYAQEQMARMQGAANGDGDSVSNFQRQNDAFMKLMGDSKDTVVKQGPSVDNKVTKAAGGPAKRVRSDGTNVAQDEATHDLRRDKRLPPENVNVAQDAATSPYNRDRMPSAPQEVAPDAGAVNVDDTLPWIAAILGTRALARRGGPAVPSDPTPNPGTEVGPVRPYRMPDDIIDAQWSDARDLPPKREALPAPREQLPAPQKRLTAPDEPEAVDGPKEEAREPKPRSVVEKNAPRAPQDDFFDAVMRNLGDELHYEGVQHNMEKALNADSKIDKAIGKAATIKGKVPKVK